MVSSWPCATLAIETTDRTTATMSKLILISNRLPVTLRHGRDGVQHVARSSGGLVSGLAPLHERGETLWFGYPGEDLDDQALAILEERRLVPVAVSSGDYRAYYSGYSNSALWPLFHYLIERCSFSNREFEAYERVNALFADAVAKRAVGDESIWVHDYQLMLLPGMLRERLPDARIGFFLHIPFPSSEVFRVLPQREQILEGLLGADLIGVHTYDYAYHLTRSLRRVLGLDVGDGMVRFHGRQVRIETHSLGIESDEFRRNADSPRVERRLAALREDMGDRKVILGVDRLDYTKGLPLKLAAFQHLLSGSADLRDKVVFVQVAVPSRTGIEGYRTQRQEVERLVGRINGRFGQPGLVPVHYIYRSIPQEELLALYRLADVAFVAPLRDGLNLVAKEYVACRNDGGGALVLSEFAGAASELGEALRVNPWDVEATAATLQRALDMGPEERSERMTAMHRRVIGSNVHRWVARFMRSLATPMESRPEPPMTTPYALAQEAGPRFARAETALLLLDYDGTLREFEPRYEQAIPTEEILDLLRDLGSLPGVQVFINSGRTREFLAEWFRGLPVSLVSEHGAWGRFWPETRWEPLGTTQETAWKNDVRTVLTDYVARTPGSRIEEKDNAMVWHYREADPELAQWQARELASLLDDLTSNRQLEVMEGAQVVEVRGVGVDKGIAYHLIDQRLGPFDFVLATGDDRTDEDLFAVLGPTVDSVYVGKGRTGAKVALPSSVAMRIFLRALIGARKSA